MTDFDLVVVLTLRLLLSLKSKSYTDKKYRVGRLDFLARRPECRLDLLGHHALKVLGAVNGLAEDGVSHGSVHIDLSNGLDGGCVLEASDLDKAYTGHALNTRSSGVERRSRRETHVGDGEEGRSTVSAEVAVDRISRVGRRVDVYLADRGTE